MRGIILAAGRGSRMGTFTAERPKCMLEFGGKTLLAWQRDAFAANGISEVGIVTGYCSDAFDGLGLPLFANPRWQSTNMVRSLACAAAWLADAPAIVSYADIFYERSAMALLAGADVDLGVLYDVNWRAQWERRFADPLEDAETFRIDPAGALREIGRRAQTLDEIEGQYMGLLRFTPAGWRAVAAHVAALAPEAADALSMTALLDALIARGVRVDGVPFAGWWGEIDTASDLAVHADRLAAQQRPRPRRPRT